MSVDELAGPFRTEDTDSCSRSPFYGRLNRRIADERAIVELLMAAPERQRLPVLLLAAVHSIVLRLSPAAGARATALLPVADLGAAVRLGTRLRGAFGELVDALEFFTDEGLGWALTHVDGLAWPLDGRHGAYVLAELACTAGEVPLERLLEGALARAFEDGAVADGAIAASDAQRAVVRYPRGHEHPKGVNAPPACSLDRLRPDDREIRRADRKFQRPRRRQEGVRRDLRRA